MVTKGDSLEKATISNLDLRQYDLGLKREQFFIRMSSKCRSVPRQQVFILGNYRCEMDHVLDQPAFEIRPCAARDSGFLQIWREIVKAAGSLEEAEGASSGGGVWRTRLRGLLSWISNLRGN